MTKSNQTKNYQKKSLITFWLSQALTFIPMIYFVISGFVQGETVDKVKIGCVAIVCLVLTIYMFFAKLNLRRTLFWILILTMITMFDKMTACFITMAICNIIDEVIVCPLHKRFKEDYHTNKQFDKRVSELNGDPTPTNV